MFVQCPNDIFFSGYAIVFLPVLCQPERVFEGPPAEPADEVSDPVLDLGELGSRLLRHLNNVELGVDIAWKK